MIEGSVESVVNILKTTFLQTSLRHVFSSIFKSHDTGQIM